MVYYQSYTHPYMGWRINVVDNFNKRFLHRINTANSGASVANGVALGVLGAAVLLCMLK